MRALLRKRTGKFSAFGASVVVFLLLFLILELCFAGRQQSQTIDEANHIFAGYRYWMCSDFRANAEHPPVVKLVAAAPLLLNTLKSPVSLCDYVGASKERDYSEGKLFLYANDADAILFKTRFAASVFTIALAATLFESGMILFGIGPALLALLIFVFDPNILAHGFLVTTDMAMACALYTTVYAFYRYLVDPSKYRILLTGIWVGITLAVKHSGFLVFPIVGALAFLELITSTKSTNESQGWIKPVQRMMGALVIMAIGGYVVLWAFYGFRFAPALDGNTMGYPLTEPKSNMILGIGNTIFEQLERIHFLPDSYLYGLKNVLHVSRNGSSAFLFGKVYPHGQWFYFPSAFVIKSTLGFLCLLMLAAASWAFGRNRESSRKLFFLTVPPILLLICSTGSNLNIGVRHILPIYPFLIMFAAAGAWKVCGSRYGMYAVAILAAVHILSSVRSFPNYIAYSNEMWGGPQNTYKVLSDSNVDWGQGVKSTASYLRNHATKDCWFAPFSTFAGADPKYYGIRCKLFPTHDYEDTQQLELSGSRVNGTLLIGASQLSGILWGPPELNPYAQLRSMTPVANIGGSVLVFQGQFDLPAVFIMSLTERARELAQNGRGDEAVIEARRATMLAPDMFITHWVLGKALAAANESAEAQIFERRSANSCA